MFIASILLSAVAPVAPKSVPDSLLQDMIGIVTVKDDPLEPSILLHTKNLLKDKPPSEDEAQDYFFSLSEDRATKKRTYFISVYRFYLDRSIRFYTVFNYLGAEGPVELPVPFADRKVSKCFPSLDMCTFQEAFTLKIPEKDFLTLATMQDDLTPWNFKYTGRSGSETRHLMLPAEAKALLKRADLVTSQK